MLPNPVTVPTSPGAAPAANDRPQLKIAARSPHDTRDHHPSSLVINEEVREFHGQWQRTLETVKAALADLERTCESAIEAREANVTGLIETLVESASADAATAAEETRAKAQVEISELQSAVTDLQARVEALQSDLDGERASVQSAREQLEINVAGRELAEAERDDVRSESERRSAEATAQLDALRSESDALRAELAAVRQQFDAAIAERSKLASTFQVIQQALAQGPAVNLAALNDVRAGASPILDRGPQDTSTPSGGTAETSATPPSAPADPRIALADRHPEVVDDVKRVLEQVEDIYQLDVTSGRSGTELVDSLAGSLRYARDLIVTRWQRDDCDAETLFAFQMALMLDLKGGTSFGRHLSIASYDLPKPPAAAASDSEEDRIS